MKSQDSENFEIEITTNSEFLKKAQTLRCKVFFKDQGTDVDEFDEFCDHLVAIEKNTQKVVGTYRLLLGSEASRGIGFYAERIFDMKNIKKNCQGQLLEMGRACVDESYRKHHIINLMWGKILAYFKENNIQYVFGSAGINN